MNESRGFSGSSSRLKIPPMDVRMRPNKRYEGVKASIDTGYNTRKQIERMEELRHFYKFRPDEIFRRVTITTLAALMLEVAKLEIQELDLEDIEQEQRSDVDIGSSEDDYKEQQQQQQPPPASEAPFATMGSIRSGGRRFYSGSFRSGSVAADLAQGIGEMDYEQRLDSVSVVDGGGGGESATATPQQRPYSLLDVREPEDFAEGHLPGAEHYPMARLSRFMTFETPAMLRLKNRPGKIIVVYDASEEGGAAARCATTLIQRGYDNVFMLSGGTRVARIKFPQGLWCKGSKSGSMDESDILVVEERMEEEMTRAVTRMSGMSCRGGGRLSASQPALDLGKAEIGSGRHRRAV